MPPKSKITSKVPTQYKHARYEAIGYTDVRFENVSIGKIFEKDGAVYVKHELRRDGDAYYNASEHFEVKPPKGTIPKHLWLDLDDTVTILRVKHPDWNEW